MTRTPQKLEAEVLALLGRRGAGRTVCPSEVARAVAGSAERREWEPLMQPVREAAFALADRGVLDITQRGKVVDGRTARGPIRLRRRET